QQRRGGRVGGGEVTAGRQGDVAGAAVDAEGRAAGGGDAAGVDRRDRHLADDQVVGVPVGDGAGHVGRQGDDVVGGAGEVERPAAVEQQAVGGQPPGDLGDAGRLPV